jgi:hypothetical protein
MNPKLLAVNWVKQGKTVRAFDTTFFDCPAIHESAEASALEAMIT